MRQRLRHALAWPGSRRLLAGDRPFVAALLLLPVAALWPLPLQGASALPDAQFWWDYLIVAEVLEGVPRALLAGASPFDARFFHPVAGARGFSEMLLLPAVVLAPVSLTAGGLAAAALLLVASYAAGGVAMYALVLELAGAQPGTPQRLAALGAGIAWAWATRFVHDMANVQLVAAFFLPLAILALRRAVRLDRLRDHLLLAAACAGQLLTCSYYGIFLALALPPALVAEAASQGKLRSRGFWLRAAGSLGAAALAAGLLLLPQARLLAAHGLHRTRLEVLQQSGDLPMLFWFSRTNALWRALGASDRYHWDSSHAVGGAAALALLAGLAVAGAKLGGSRWLLSAAAVPAGCALALVAAFGLFAVGAPGAGLLVAALPALAALLLRRAGRPVPEGFAALWLVGLVGLCLYLGPEVHARLQSGSLGPGPFAPLFRLPVLDSLRMVRRASVLFLLATCALGGAGIATALHAVRGRRGALVLGALLPVAALGELVLAEESLLPRSLLSAPARSEAERFLAAAEPGAYAVAPTGSDAQRCVDRFVAARLGRPLAGGAAGYVPTLSRELSRLADDVAAPQAVAHLRAAGVRFLLLRGDLGRPLPVRQQQLLAGLERNRELTLVHHGPDGAVLRLAEVPPPLDPSAAGPASGPALRLRSSTALGGALDPGAAADGDEATAATGPGIAPVAEGLLIELDSPGELAELRLVIRPGAGFPRSLRIEAETAPGRFDELTRAATLFPVRGLAAGDARLELSFPLGGIRASAVRLTTLAPGPWAISELQLRGR